MATARKRPAPRAEEQIAKRSGSAPRISRLAALKAVELRSRGSNSLRLGLGKRRWSSAESFDTGTQGFRHGTALTA